MSILSTVVLMKQISAGFIDSCITVANRLLAFPDVLKPLVTLEQRYGLQGPWNSIYKIQAVVSKAKTGPNRQWTMQMLAYSFLSGQVERQGFSVRYLAGRAGDIGLVSLMVGQRTLKPNSYG